MKFLVLLHMDPDRMRSLTPSEEHELQIESARQDEELMRAGKLIVAEALDQPNTAVCVRRRDGTTSVTDGPYVETKEHLGGFLLVEARDREEAIRIAVGDGRFLELGTTFEIRPIFDYRARLGPTAGG